MEPRQLAERAERRSLAAEDGRERFYGFGLMGLPFDSGHVLALRRMPASSIGPGHTAVWHRDPTGRWSFYTDVEPWQSCPRFFGRALASSQQRPIRITWTSPRSFQVLMPGDDELSWDVVLRQRFATRLMSMLGRGLPESAWSNPAVLGLMARMAGPLLGAGRIRLHGRTPNGQAFTANPRLLWAVDRSSARFAGEDLGRPSPLPEQARLGEFWIPQKGILAFGDAFFDAFDPALHQQAITGPLPEREKRVENTALRR